jgi:hypothetical protein
MQNILKVAGSVILIAGLTACAYPQGYSQQAPHSATPPPGYVKLPPQPKPQPRRVIIRTETHRVLTPQIIMEPCCRMQPDVIYIRKR